ncbi:hypothetical protein [Kribbella capetownensis]|uniref:hypothetical protein n=1 Tax=Kribbella capetownensis TaxID=1572659 RepID=UPI00192DE74A|nr:hypothetical protein [Kribbella capetownensis]
MFAGFVFSNSEVGAGALTLAPQLVVQVCDNGLTINKEIRREIHRGGPLADGLIRWSDETRKKEIELIRSKTKDAVTTFLDVDYVTRAIADLEATASKPIGSADKVVRAVGKKLAFSEDQIDGILDHFIAGGQRTAGGVLQAVTSYAQTIAPTSRTRSKPRASRPWNSPPPRDEAGPGRRDPYPRLPGSAPRESRICRASSPQTRCCRRWPATPVH